MQRNGAARWSGVARRFHATRRFLAGDPALVAEMKQVLSGLETPAEREAIEGAGLADHRAYFDVQPPALPPSVLIERAPGRPARAGARQRFRSFLRRVADSRTTREDRPCEAGHFVTAFGAGKGAHRVSRLPS